MGSSSKHTKAKRSGAFGRLFKSKKKAPLSSQETSLSVDGSGSSTGQTNDGASGTGRKGNKCLHPIHNLKSKSKNKRKSKRLPYSSSPRKNSGQDVDKPKATQSTERSQNHAGKENQVNGEGWNSPLRKNFKEDKWLEKKRTSPSDDGQKDQEDASPQNAYNFPKYYDFQKGSDELDFNENSFSRHSTSSGSGSSFLSQGSAFEEDDIFLSEEFLQSTGINTANSMSSLNDEVVGFGCNAWSMFCGDKANDANTRGSLSLKDNFRNDVSQRLQVRVEVENITAEDEEVYSQPRDGDMLSLSSDDKVMTRSALSRPFGRTSLPAHLAKTWIVEVTSSRFDQVLQQCVYNIMVQKEDYTFGKGKEKSAESSPIQNELSLSGSFMAADIDRTLKDFMWLEEALMEEYHGSLLSPMLSLALTSGTDWTTAGAFDKDSFERGEWDPLTISSEILLEASQSSEPVDTKLLADWLSDVLNSVRGRGELILNHAADVVHSEAMEAFLYNLSGPLPEPRFVHLQGYESEESKWSWENLKSILHRTENEQDSLFSGLMKANLQCLGIADECGLNKQSTSIVEDPNMHHSDKILSRRNRIYEQQENPEKWHRIIRSKSLRAQRFYISAQKENTLRAMYRLRMLLEKEILLSAAWKRFAISLSMLFAAEKDVEDSKIGRSKDASSSKKTKVGRTIVDDNLRILARQKVDRSIPSLKVLSGMLNAYYADFSAVDPSLREYTNGIGKVMKSKNANLWQNHLKAPIKLLRGGSTGSTSDKGMRKVDRFAAEERLSTNEEYIKSSVMQVCKAMKIRLSRMSWKFFKMESGQVSLLLSASEQVRSNLKNARSRSSTSLDEEKADNEKEAELVRQIMELGFRKKYKYQPLPKSSASSHTSSDTSDTSDFERSSLSLEGDNETSTTDDGGTINSPLFESVTNFAKTYVGRWNAELAQEMLETTGIEVVDFNMEETSKSLRAVSKLALSLKESVVRCQEAINMLIEVGKKSTEDGIEYASIEEMRNGFLADLALIFSGSSEPGQIDPSNEAVLSSIGIDVHDSAGWSKLSQTKGKCGAIAMKYQQIRSHGTDDFLNRMRSRMVNYKRIIEEVENYIWMHRVGYYVEKHYSNLRAEALAAWEKKTDITTAINIATKKRLTLLVKELKEKLEIIGPSVSYSSVKEAKERHLGSKALKNELEALASRRFQRLKDSFAANCLSIVNEWALREESAAKAESKCLREAIKEIERDVRRRKDTIKADGGAHLFASTMNPSSSKS